VTSDLEQLAADKDSYTAGLQSFAAASEQAASERRAGGHAAAQATRAARSACPQRGRICTSDFDLRSHPRSRQRPHN